eukprot:c9810_g1_i1.p1 GENE.c9810_g1_i1~~c9810_g1_i1.p1  ORF type:complete len:740 (-),score=176.80 c9810_g1_i1:131-2125(-)
MTVTTTVVGGVEQEHDTHEHSSNPPPPSIGLAQLIDAGVLCNVARVNPDTSNGIKLVGGNGIDQALLLFALKEGVKPDEITKSHPLLAQIPFSAATKYAVTIHSNPAVDVESGAGGPIIYFKGAPEIVTHKCLNMIDSNGQVVPIDHAHLDTVITGLGNSGKRVIAIAKTQLSATDYPPSFVFNTDNPNFPIDQLTLLGLVAVSDPPRDGVAETIELAKGAGVRVMMVTGDHQTTAAAIARQVGIITHPVVKTMRDYPGETDWSRHPPRKYSKPRKSSILEQPLLGFHAENHIDNFDYRQKSIPEALVINGHDLFVFGDEHWNWALKFEQIVFARTTPEQKFQIVTECQLRGHTVAVTGDGVNDAPALSKADVGVAMNEGADVAREAADIVLIDSKFTSLIAGIREGRLVFENLQKVVLYLLPAGSFSEMIPVIVNVFLGMPLPLSSFLMIVICMCTDMLGSIALIYEAPEADIMHRRPRNLKTDRLVSWKLLSFGYGFMGVLESLAAFGMYFWCWSRKGVHPSQLVFAWQFDSPNGFAGLTASEVSNVLNESQCVFFTTLVICQIGNLLSTRKRRVPYFYSKQPDSIQRRQVYRLFGAAVAAVTWVLLVTEIPPIRKLFKTATVQWQFWLGAIGCSVVIFVLGEVRKWWMIWRPDSWIARAAW